MKKKMFVIVMTILVLTFTLEKINAQESFIKNNHFRIETYFGFTSSSSYFNDNGKIIATIDKINTTRDSSYSYESNSYHFGILGEYILDDMFSASVNLPILSSRLQEVYIKPDSNNVKYKREEHSFTKLLNFELNVKAKLLRGKIPLTVQLGAKIPTTSISSEYSPDLPFIGTNYFEASAGITSGYNFSKSALLATVTYNYRNLLADRLSLRADAILRSIQTTELRVFLDYSFCINGMNDLPLYDLTSTPIKSNLLSAGIAFDIQLIESLYFEGGYNVTLDGINTLNCGLYKFKMGFLF